MIPIRYVILEGVDCCGKTSLYSAIHKTTKFKYNIHDRSFLSMLCYARLYGRDVSEYRRGLHDELCDANNFMIILMPPLEVILGRYRQRGDEFQDETSLKKLYEIFRDETDKISHLANVRVVPDELSIENLASVSSEALSEYSRQSFKVFGHSEKNWTSLNAGSEVQFRVSLDVDPDHSDVEIMNDPHEGDYYLGILRDLEGTIHAEMSGKNPYGVPQGMDSRRFYYSSDTCISSIHLLPREGELKVLCALRSTDAKKNGSIDLRFLAHLAAEVPRTFGWRFDKIRLDVRYNSLHIRSSEV
jgi:thymidylate kinase